jgi:RNA polymerase sigma factor for flagellar operon FliA
MQRVQSAAEGEALFLSELDLIEGVIALVCARHHLPAAEAEDFASDVKLKLVQNEYAIIRKFEGRSTFRSYLTIVIQRLFLDRRISAWGKWRPSAQAKRSGPLAVLLDQLLNRDGYTLNEACELLATKYRLSVTRADIDMLAARVTVRQRRRLDSDDGLEEVPAAGPDPGDLVTEHRREALAERVSAILKRVMATLDRESQLILVLRFEDGHSVADIASLLHADQKGLYRRVERLLRQLRDALEADGVDADSVVEMLESPAVSVDWSSLPPAGISSSRPSMTKGPR